MSFANEQEPNYYELFGVDRDAPLSEIRASYRRLMQQAGNHPDLGGDTQTAALINRAYSVLKNSDQRKFYDARLDILTRIAAGIEMESAPDPEPLATHRLDLGQDRITHLLEGLRNQRRADRARWFTRAERDHDPEDGREGAALA